MWITIEGRLRVSIQWLVYRKRPGGRHDLPEHSFEHNNMHTSRRPASLMLTGLHTPESPVEPTGPDDTGSSTYSCSIGQLSNGMRCGPLSGPWMLAYSPHTPHAARSAHHATCTQIPKLECARMLPLPPRPAVATALSTHPLEDPDLQGPHKASGQGLSPCPPMRRRPAAARRGAHAHDLAIDRVRHCLGISQ